MRPAGAQLQLLQHLAASCRAARTQQPLPGWPPAPDLPPSAWLQVVRHLRFTSPPASTGAAARAPVLEERYETAGSSSSSRAFPAGRSDDAPATRGTSAQGAGAAAACAAAPRTSWQPGWHVQQHDSCQPSALVAAPTRAAHWPLSAAHAGAPGRQAGLAGMGAACRSLHTAPTLHSGGAAASCPAGFGDEHDSLHQPQQPGRERPVPASRLPRQPPLPASQRGAAGGLQQQQQQPGRQGHPSGDGPGGGPSSAAEADLRQELSQRVQATRARLDRQHAACVSHAEPSSSSSGRGSILVPDRLDWTVRTAQAHLTRQPGEIPVEEQRLLQVAVAGAPNAGKSTLVNALVGQKVSAVSPKTNTTAAAALGALTRGAAQVVLYDTPGVVDQKHYRNPRHARKVQSAWGIAADCDLLLFVVDAERQLRQPDPRLVRVLEDLGKGKRMGGIPNWDCPPSLLLLNKVDLLPAEVRSEAVARLAQRLAALHAFEDVLTASALSGMGVPQLADYLVSRATPGAWTLPAGVPSDAAPTARALEVTREKLFRRTWAELPYELRLAHVAWRRLADGSIRVEQDVWCPTLGVKKIVVGARGAVVGQVGMQARHDLEELLGARVHLILNVRVEKTARRQPGN